jgi:hypothetical protein
LLIVHDWFESWMPRRRELDSNNCHVERSETSLALFPARFDQMISGLRLLRMTEEQSWKD